ncbi:Hpt domain-containing protein [bacterium]|nr:Hpt domain-containing protein [bacterium]
MNEKRLDWEKVASLAGFSAEESGEIFAELWQEFLTAFPHSHLALEKAVAASDTKRTQLTAHLLKGMSNNLGAFRLGAFYAEIEEKAKAGSGKKALFEQLIGQAAKEYTELSSEVRTSLKAA